ncbi:hypothetical protein [Mycobacterium sp. DL440]|uniref:DUF7172 family protein n=1 Tax=Mycobacterium sp. DL440 TaxID=2675523 RepID=UPI00141EB36F|nr:hypothetical protein [Mycobacterium sp. DL440]
MSNDHFLILDEAIEPQPWTQYRILATKTAPSVSRTYDTSGGSNKDELVHTVDVQWTNNTPVPQQVYGMVTRGGSQVTLQARSRGYLQMLHGADKLSTPTPPSSFDMIEVSRFGCGMDTGKGGILAVGTGFAVHEVRQNSITAPFMPHSVGWETIAPGETFFGRVQIRFKSDYWEATIIDGGDQNTESLFISGDTRVDLYGVPAFAAPAERPTPTVVGVEHSINNTFPTDVDVPAGTAAGDVMVAVVANNIGLASDITPSETGWTLWHVRNDGLLGIGDVHMKVYWRIASASEPASYHFTTGALAEEIVHLITLRDASPDLTEWHVASTLTKRFWELDTGNNMCPSIDRDGQLLICASYVAHTPLQAPINQTAPDDMTLIEDSPADGSTMASAVLADPPRPTLDRGFTPSKVPQWSGRSIALAILVPGAVTI